MRNRPVAVRLPTVACCRRSSLRRAANNDAVTASSEVAPANRNPCPATQPSSSSFAHLLFVLDALGDRFEAERFAEHHHGARELRALVLLGQPADERAVDLQDVDREAVQVGKRRIAHAEIVDREPHAERLELAEALQVDLGVVHDRALGQLDHQVARVEARDVERVAHVGDQVRVLQVAAGDVDRDPQAVARCDRLCSMRGPGGRLSTSTQRPSSTIWPDSSAIGMKSPGITRPCSG